MSSNTITKRLEFENNLRVSQQNTIQTIIRHNNQIICFRALFTSFCLKTIGFYIKTFLVILFGLKISLKMFVFIKNYEKICSKIRLKTYERKTK